MVRIEAGRRAVLSGWAAAAGIGLAVASGSGVAGADATGSGSADASSSTVSGVSQTSSASDRASVPSRSAPKTNPRHAVQSGSPHSAAPFDPADGPAGDADTGTTGGAVTDGKPGHRRHRSTAAGSEVSDNAMKTAVREGRPVETTAAHEEAGVARSLEPGETDRGTRAAMSATATTTPVFADAGAGITPRGGVVRNLLTNVVALLRSPGATNPPEPSRLPGPSVLEMVFAGLRRASAGEAPTAQSDVTTSPNGQPQSGNLLINSGAEAGDPSLSGYASVSIPGWTVTGTPTVIQYGTLRRLPGLFGTKGPTLRPYFGFPSANHAPLDSGPQFFGGGNVATSTLTQTVDLTAAQSAVAAGTLPYVLSAALGGSLLDGSAATVKVNFLDAHNAYLGSGSIGPVTALDRRFQTELQQRLITGTVPIGTRSAQIVVTLTDRNPILGNYNNAYADDLSFTVGTALSAPPNPLPPESNVGALDHVVMVYMENHGVGDIVGSPNAPYINSLINAYGNAANYYALTHPSDPNYWPILGGSDFGLNYNCASDCFDAPNLADEIIAAGKEWAAYQDGGGGYSEPNDRTPFLAFHDINANQALVRTFLFLQLSPLFFPLSFLA